MLKNDFGPEEDPMLGSIVILPIPSKTIPISYNSYFEQLILKGRTIDIKTIFFNTFRNCWVTICSYN